MNTDGDGGGVGERNCRPERKMKLVAYTIKAVPQTYAGARFRSTLEADWAATFDVCKVAWSYEPEAVQLPSGQFYRPDFWLPGLDVWFEVKGPAVPGRGKTWELSEATDKWAVIGEVPLNGFARWWLMDPPSGLEGWAEKYEALCAVLGVPAALNVQGEVCFPGWGDLRTFARAPRPGTPSD